MRNDESNTSSISCTCFQVLDQDIEIQAQLDRLAHRYAFTISSPLERRHKLKRDTRLNLLEAENQHLREMLLEDKDKEDESWCSFISNKPEDGETVVKFPSCMEDPIDPTIQCQTVQFVRPNASLNEI